MHVPDVEYARSGDVAVAYQVVGEGPLDLVYVPFLSNLYSLWQWPYIAEGLRRLAASCRLVLVNTRGVGLSDRPRSITIESRVDDIRAVMDNLGLGRSTVLGWAETANTCAVLAASYPERVERLILYLPYARGVAGPNYPWGQDQQTALASVRTVRERWGEREFLEAMGRRINPQWADDEDFLAWFVWNHRLAASPAAAAEFQRMALETDITDVLPAIRLPTLVLSKEHQRDEAQYVASRIPGARHIVLPGLGLSLHETEAAVEVIEEFLSGTVPPEIPDSVLATVLFTDLVSSTERAAELGDRRWRELLEEHQRLVRRELARYRGAEIDTAGDGFFCSFDGPARAIACARSIVQSTGELGLGVRAGLHTGECERIGEKLAGLAVHIGSRVAASGGAGEVLVSGTVRDLVAGSGFEFVDRGLHSLRGIPGEWRIYAVSNA